MADVQDYINLIPSQHRKQPNFVEFVKVLLQGFVDTQNQLALIPYLHDIDVAVGDQLDTDGLWEGVTRNLKVPLEGVYFAWGTAGVGWGQGTWKGPYDPSTALYVLPDDAFRILVKAKIASNHWDGTVPGAYAIWATVFGPHQIILQDNQDMSMTILWLGKNLTAVVSALLTGGYLALKPAGVRIKGYFEPSDPNLPVFAWGIESDRFKGWGEGAWMKKVG